MGAKNTLQISIKKWFNQNKKKVKKFKLETSNMTTVGIHHRRGDHLLYENAYNIPHVTMSYLGPSMDLFRNKFKNVIFIYVSDDKHWVQKHLNKDRDIIVS